jgi:hypothetical protein
MSNTVAHKMRWKWVKMLLALITCALSPTASQAQSWQQVYDDVMDAVDATDGDDSMLAESYELLQQLADHPIDLNRATRHDLEQLPFLTAQQVMDLQEYLYRYGPMRSLGELRMVRSLDHRQLALLPFFVYVTGLPDTPPADTLPPLDTLLHRARQTLSGTLRVPFYRREGDRDGYLGYPLRHTLRYELNSCDQLRIGLTAAQDAGEPFFANANGWGYDNYSYYVQLRRIGRLDNLVVGKYKMAAGMGLVLGQSFQLGKLATLQSLGRTTATLRPHGSRSEADYFQGAAATVSMLGHQPDYSYSAAHGTTSLLLTAFASYRPIDATLNGDSTARTLITSGYHRTPIEMGKKHNTHMGTGGAHLAFQLGALRVGATAVYTALDRSLQPQRETLYRRHAAHGQHFLNMSMDYAYMHHRLSLSGETATDGHGHLATLNALSWQPSARIGLMALQRFYSYRYTTLHGHAFGASSQVQNESGIYIGATWNPLARLQLQAYADYAYFAWPRYGVSQPSSEATDFLLQVTWQNRQWTLQARHRSHLKQKDNEKKTALMANDEHRERLSLAYSHDQWTLKTQIDLSRVHTGQTEQGWLISQHAACTATLGRSMALQLSAMAALFNTDSYQSRIYVYERQLQHEFYFPTYYGEGLRMALQARADVGSRLRLALRLGHTNYFDRSAIGTGLQQISHSHQTDLDMQLRWKF